MGRKVKIDIDRTFSITGVTPKPQFTPIESSNLPDAYATFHSRDYYRGKSFHYAGEWVEGAHYTSDDYTIDFVSKNNCLLACAKNHISSLENEPKDWIVSDEGQITGIVSTYWDFVLSGTKSADITYQTIINALGYVPANIDFQSDNNFSDWYKEKLDSLNINYNTTDYWNKQIGYVPAKGEIIVYSDYKTKQINGHNVYIPGVKIGSGNGYVQDLMFLDDDLSEDLMNHINDNIRHITAQERSRWNNKLNVTDAQEVVEENLIFNRN